MPWCRSAPRSTTIRRPAPAFERIRPGHNGAYEEERVRATKSALRRRSRRRRGRDRTSWHLSADRADAPQGTCGENARHDSAGPSRVQMPSLRLIPNAPPLHSRRRPDGNSQRGKAQDLHSQSGAKALGLEDDELSIAPCRREVTACQPGARSSEAGPHGEL